MKSRLNITTIKLVDYAFLFSFQTKQVREKMERASGVINKQQKPNYRGRSEPIP